jgi:hypothetical protein
MKRWMFSISILCCSFACAIVSACPMCKDSIPNGEPGGPAQAGTLPGGFNTSVYFLLLGLFFTIGLISIGLVRGIRSTNARIIPSGQNSRGFEVRPSDSSQGGTE